MTLTVAALLTALKEVRGDRMVATPAWIIARRLDVSVESVQRLLTKLERRGLVEVDHWTGAAAWWRVTAAGEKALEGLRAAAALEPIARRSCEDAA